MRLFVGLGLPDTLREALAACYGGLDGARWVPVENLHLTIRFVGEVSNPVADEIDHALSGIAARGFALSVGGTGVFERQGRSSTLWVGVSPREPALEHLRGKIEHALQRTGLPPERKRFQPHISLARVDAVAPHQLAGWMQAHNLLRAGPCPFDRFTLFSSLLGKEQAVYIPEVEYELD